MMPDMQPQKYDQPKPRKKRSGMAMVPIWAWVAAGVLALFGVALVARWCLGAAFVADYEQGTYREDIPEVMRTVNFPQSHVGDYDMGLVKYREGDYEQAAELFYSAVMSELPEGQDCDARVNLALSVCNQMDLDAARLGEPEELEFALNCLYFSRDALMENGCAADDDSFHDEDAQQLKEDIDKLIEELEQKQQGNGGDDDDDDSDGDDDQDEDQPQGQGGQEQQDPLRDQLKNQQKQNSQQMQQYQDTQDQMNQYLNGNTGNGGGGGSKPW